MISIQLLFRPENDILTVNSEVKTMGRHYLTNDELSHANYKYIKREWKNGKWQYYYDLPKGNNGSMHNRAKASLKKAADQSANKNAVAKKPVDKAALKRQGEASLNNRLAAERMRKDHDTTMRNSAKAKASLKRTGEAELDNRLNEKVKANAAKADLKRQGEAARESTKAKQTNEKAAERMRKDHDTAMRNRAKGQLGIPKDNATLKKEGEAALNKKLDQQAKNSAKAKASLKKTGEAELDNRLNEKAKSDYKKTISDYVKTYPARIESAKGYVSSLLGSVKKKKKNR